MRRAAQGLTILALNLVSAIAFAHPNSPRYAPRIKDGWEILFDGKDLQAWDVDRTAGARPVGAWEHYKITANGSHVTVVMNGKEIVNVNLARWTIPGHNPDGQHNKFPYAIASLPREGFIGPQNYGGVPVWFRNIRIRPLTNRLPKYTGDEPIADVLDRSAKR